MDSFPRSSVLFAHSVPGVTGPRGDGAGPYHLLALGVGAGVGVGMGVAAGVIALGMGASEAAPRAGSPGLGTPGGKGWVDPAAGAPGGGAGRVLVMVAGFVSVRATTLFLGTRAS